MVGKVWMVRDCKLIPPIIKLTSASLPRTQKWVLWWQGFHIVQLSRDHVMWPYPTPAGHPCTHSMYRKSGKNFYCKNILTSS